MKSQSRVKTIGMLIIAMSIILYGCSSSKKETTVSPNSEAPNTSAPTEAPAKTEKASIRLATAMDPTRLAPYEKVVADWNAKHPETEVVLENTPYAEYWQKIQVMTASKTLPDIWVFTPGLGSQWLENDQLLSLSSYIKNDSALNIEDYHKMMIDYMTYKGEVYGFPYDVSAQVLFYNKDLFDQAKLDYPTDKWTFDDVRTAAKKISELKSDKGKVYGLLSTMAGDFTADSYFRAFGSGLITKDGKVGLNNQGGIDTLQYFKDNIDQGITPKPEPGSPTRPIWLNGLAGMMADGGWAIPSFKDVPFKWDMVSIPAGPQGQFTTGLGGTYVVSKQTKFPKASYEFLKYLTSTESLNQLITQTDAGVPGRISSQAGLSPLLKKYADLISNATPFSAINGTLEMQEILGKDLEQVFNGTMSPADAVKDIELKGNKVLEDKQKK
ncbi:ABC transporter substrate-binding protein [Paenibacillus baekrokdamisoli]|uniref:ABC transporter substrate-binding protein n=1 Tax=Paenibacillus baekrokdamisoli TaxID=1712516 RepID=A0A3G9J8X6_9BACL|nr:sugar ABC transporter substrate-binding protein [Paenibacillus baekrokdamisoli]MBB3067084.1 multiple sugar transport system substrate-binding protein [Paenibacillus baekrokdamisoli]BBH19724.1 ABC transporter substrate-binding protein [Paenibacillus baekrokdamisoli]